MAKTTHSSGSKQKNDNLTNQDLRSDLVANPTKTTSPKTTQKSASTAKPGEPTTMEELLAQTGYQLKSHQKGEIVEGKVTFVSDKHLLLDIGGKGEAIVHEKEMPHIADLVNELKVGDRLKVQIVNPENERGQTVVSLRKTAASKRWQLLGDKMKSQQQVEVTIKELSRGGFLVDYMGLRGFIPLSQAQPEFVRLAEKAAGRRVTVQIIELDEAQNRLVLSQIAGGIGEKQAEALKQVELGKSYPAEITGLAPFGAFANVTVGENILPGLIHISEIAWEKVDKPEAYLKVGQKLDVKAIGADPKIGKLTLSIKQLLPDPWEDVAKILTVDQTIKGKVTRINQFGAFISILPGIEGLVHISKINPGEEPKVGEEVECVVEEINPEKRKVSLSFVVLAKPIGYR